jgi:uncharacterized protein (TIGR02284 family)
MDATAVEVLNDLILMNNDRIKGYQRTMQNLKPQDDDLRELFLKIIAQTQGFNKALTEEVVKLGATAETHTSVSGKLHLTWIGIKATFTGHNRRALLAECERGEDALKAAYMEALHGDSDLSPSQWELISAQAEEMKVIHDQIKALRDQVEK